MGEPIFVADPRLVSAGLYPLVAPPAPWVRDDLDLMYDPVCFVAGQAVRRQKRLYNQRAVKRICAFKVTCTLDFPWLSPYLFVSFCGWPVGVQLQPDSVVLCAHCQEVEGIPQQRHLVSSLLAPDRPERGHSSVVEYAPYYAASGVAGLPRSCLCFHRSP